MNWFVILLEKSAGIGEWQPDDKCVKKNKLDAQLILSIFRQPLHVSGVSGLIIRRYNCMSTTIGTYYSFYMTVCCPNWIGILIVHQVGFSLHNYIEMHGQQNIKLKVILESV